MIKVLADVGLKSCPFFWKYGYRHYFGADTGDKCIWKLFAFPVATECECSKGRQERAGQDKGKEHISEGFLPLPTTFTP